MGQGMPDDENSKLNLLSRDVNDLMVVSSMLQDGIVSLEDMAYLENECAFVMVVNRFQWEQPASDAAGERIHSGVRFDKVKRVQYRNVDRQARNRFSAILSIAYVDGIVGIYFSGNGTVLLEVDELHCALQDFDNPWPTIWRPEHSD
jgi:hypothetical protein